MSLLQDGAHAVLFGHSVLMLALSLRDLTDICHAETRHTCMCETPSDREPLKQMTRCPATFAVVSVHGVLRPHTLVHTWVLAPSAAW